MLSTFDNPHVDCVIGNREPDIGKEVGTFYRRYNFILYSRKFKIKNPLIINQEGISHGTPLILIAANNFAIKKDVWEKIGGMKTCFKRPAGEDILMEIDLLREGFNILFNPQVKVFHNHPLSLLELLKKSFYHGESINLINRVSGGFIKWKHFLQLKNFLRNLLIFVMVFFIVILMKISFYIKLIVLITILSALLVNNLLNLKRNLNSALNLRGKKYKEKYQLSFPQLFYFGLIDFLVKSIRLLGFIYSQIKTIELI